MLKNIRSGYPLRVASEATKYSMKSGDPVFHTEKDPADVNSHAYSKWEFEHVGSSGSIIMLKSGPCGAKPNGYYLHVSSGAMKSADPVFHTNSTSDGSKWIVEYK